MVTQQVQAWSYDAVPYAAPVDTGFSIPRGIAQEEERSSVLYRDIIAVIAMIVCPIIMLLVLSCINVSEEYRMQGLRTEVMTMAQENAVAKLEVSRLDAPVRIETIAEKKLGMALPVRALYGAGSKQARQLEGYNGD